MQLYLVACIVILLVERHQQYESRIRSALSQPQGAKLCWTDLTRMETRVKPLCENMLSSLAHFDHFYTEPAASHIAMDRGVFDIATELRAKQGLKTPDALHLAAALRNGCTEFWTNDRRLEKAADGRIAIVTFN